MKRGVVLGIAIMLVLIILHMGNMLKFHWDSFDSLSHLEEMQDNPGQVYLSAYKCIQLGIQSPPLNFEFVAWEFCSPI